MSLTRQSKREIINKYGKNEKDSGSAESQIALLTENIRGLQDHFKEHKKDHHSRRGLIKMVSKRRKLVKYLQKTDYESYKKLIDELEIRR
ncbi:MAG: 30S ribosomal protein S15 [Candidatus Marinimicrobia bacterium]|jgi:small subunit ribosomal protein S15|nr:30S ribosomal protein S15 [Candidatus Neomarinimicrobiota bacterium]|tara:strand:+ start:251 stop:520 length:270 start_codon:yes stop_codon:yes gene_type:complete